MTTRNHPYLVLLALAALLGLSPSEAAAQTVRPGDVRPELKEFAPEEAEPPALVLPPIPVPSGEQRDRLSSGTRVFVREFRIVGSTVFTPEELAQVTAPYTNRELRAEELIEARDAVTKYYIAHGYISSGAVLRDQRVTDGVIEIAVVEGALAEISIEGTDRFRPDYLRKRLELATRGPVNIKDLEQRLQLLQQDPRIRRVHAQLGPGEVRGESLLSLRVEEENPYQLSFYSANDESPAIGSAHGQIRVEHQNLTGNGDTLAGSFGMTEGLEEWDLSYWLPLNAHDTTLGLFYRHSESEVVESPFDELDIESESTTYGIGLRHPIYRSPRTELWAGLTGELRRSKTSLLDEGFSFPGSGADEDGDVRLSVLRLVQEWTSRSQNSVIAARSSFSFGLDILDASDFSPPSASDLPDADGTFFAWLGQFQWAYRLPKGYRATQLIFRTDVQLSPDPLPSLEKFAVGGIRTVRGYRENQLVRDNGLVSSIEFRIPIYRDPLGHDLLELAPFADFGHSWNEENTLSPKTIASLGLGLRWQLSERVFVAAYWGGRLRKVKRVGNDIQNNGWHLEAIVTTF